MGQIQTLPIQAEHLADVGQFLHENLNKRFSSERWQSSLTHEWAAVRPNYGVQLRDDGKLVGVFCAIYSDQVIDGKVELFCNPHSWCVLEAYRRHSINLVLHLVKQPGFHFTMFTPNPIVTQVFRGLKFQDLADGQYVRFNLPTWRAWRSECFAESEPDRVAARLSGQVLKNFEAHRNIPWLRFAAFGTPGDVCLVVFKPVRWKRTNCAWIMHVSDAAAYERQSDLLRHHLLWAHGMQTSRVEARWFSAPPRWAIRTTRLQPKLFKSKTLSEGQIQDIYSELMALDV